MGEGGGAKLGEKRRCRVTAVWSCQKVIHTHSLFKTFFFFFPFALNGFYHCPLHLPHFLQMEFRYRVLVASPLTSEIWTGSNRALSTLSTERWTQQCWIICLSGQFASLVPLPAFGIKGSQTSCIGKHLPPVCSLLTSCHMICDFFFFFSTAGTICLQSHLKCESVIIFD